MMLQMNGNECCIPGGGWVYVFVCVYMCLYVFVCVCLCISVWLCVCVDLCEIA